MSKMNSLSLDFSGLLLCFKKIPASDHYLIFYETGLLWYSTNTLYCSLNILIRTTDFHRSIVSAILEPLNCRNLAVAVPALCPRVYWKAKMPPGWTRNPRKLQQETTVTLVMIGTISSAVRQRTLPYHSGPQWSSSFKVWSAGTMRERFFFTCFSL